MSERTKSLRQEFYRTKFHFALFYMQGNSRGYRTPQKNPYQGWVGRRPKK